MYQWMGTGWELAVTRISTKKRAASFGAPLTGDLYAEQDKR
jgi:hypothetical protein